jgi:hypothetical protein
MICFFSVSNQTFGCCQAGYFCAGGQMRVEPAPAIKITARFNNEGPAQASHANAFCGAKQTTG